MRSRLEYAYQFTSCFPAFIAGLQEYALDSHEIITIYVSTWISPFLLRSFTCEDGSDVARPRRIAKLQDVERIFHGHNENHHRTPCSIEILNPLSSTQGPSPWSGGRANQGFLWLKFHYTIGSSDYSTITSGMLRSIRFLILIEIMNWQRNIMSRNEEMGRIMAMGGQWRRRRMVRQLREARNVGSQSRIEVKIIPPFWKVDRPRGRPGVQASKRKGFLALTLPEMRASFCKQNHSQCLSLRYIYPSSPNGDTVHFTYFLRRHRNSS